MQLGTLKDLDSILKLEEICFEPARQDSRRTLRRSLAHAHHEIWMALDGLLLCGALHLRFLKQALRIHSLAVSPCQRATGLGSKLLHFAIDRGKEKHVRKIILEADTSNPRLVEWYRRHHFVERDLLPDYYGPHTLAVRMTFTPEIQ